MSIRVALNHRTQYLYDKAVLLGPQVIQFRSCTRQDRSGTVFSVFLPHRSGSLDSSSGSKAVFVSLTEYP
jgi:hypothetical protein